MKTLNTREQKVKFLQDLHSSKVALRSVLKPVYGVLFVHEGNVFARQDKGGYKALDVEIEVEEYEARHAGTFSHIVDTIRLPGS
jgi:hypothetical protein